MFEHSPLRDRAEVEVPEEALALRKYENETSTEDREAAQTAELLDWIWDDYEFEKSVSEMEAVLGSRKTLDDNYPLAHSSTSYYRSTDPYYCIPSITQIGARTEDVSFVMPIKGTNIVGVKGQVLLYRTHIVNGRYIEIPRSRNKRRTELETYHEAGFFCFVIAEQDPEMGSVRPSLVFGDMDKAKWPSQAAKIRAVQLLSGKNYPYGHHRDEDRLFKEKEIADFEEALFTPGRKRKIKPDIKPGVLTQNKEALVSNVSDVYFANEKLIKSMQEFIDRYSKPGQVKSSKPLAASELRHPDTDEFHPIGVRHHHLSWEHMHRAEIAELPLFQAVSKATDKYYAAGAPVLYFPSICRAIGILLKDTPRDQLFDRLHRTELTDDETKLIHSLEDIILTAVSTGMDGKRERRFVNPRWIDFLDSRPDLYPGITAERLLSEPKLVASLQYQYLEGV